MKKVFLTVIGILALLLAAVGIIIPGLPTTPFVLLAGAAFLKSSPKIYQKLIDSKIFGAYIRRYKENGLDLPSLLSALSLMWAMILLSVYFLIQNPVTSAIIIAVGMTGTAVMAAIAMKTQRNKK